MGLTMSPGSVIQQLDEMSAQLEDAIKNAKIVLKNVASYELSKVFLRGKSYDASRKSYGDLHIPIIHGIIVYAQALNAENNIYKAHIGDFLSGIGYVDEDALLRDKEHIEQQINYVKNVVSVQKGSYSTYLGCLEQALDLVEKKLEQISAFKDVCSGLYSGLNGFVLYISAGIDCINNSSYDFITGTYQVNIPCVFWTVELEKKWRNKLAYDMLDDNLKMYLNIDDFKYTDDGFIICTKPLSDILKERRITDTSISKIESDVDLFYDDWYLYAVPDADGIYTYSLLKMREQETDASEGDKDDPGVAIAFIEFDIEKLTDISPNNTDMFVSEINKVTLDKGKRHNEILQKYFSDINSEASYLVADMYIDKIASLCEDNTIMLPNKMSDAPERVINALNEINEKSGLNIYDPENNCIHVQDSNNLTEDEKYAIFITYTSNENFNSFAAEVKFHSDALVSWHNNIPILGRSEWYERAIRADMAIGEEKESNTKGGFDEYYDLDSGIVNEQEKVHGVQ